MKRLQKDTNFDMEVFLVSDLHLCDPANQSDVFLARIDRQGVGCTQSVDSVLNTLRQSGGSGEVNHALALNGIYRIRNWSNLWANHPEISSYEDQST